MTFDLASPSSAFLGFADPPRDSQVTFRALMDAMSRPAQPVPLTVACDMPPTLDPVVAAVGLTLLDETTPAWVDRRLIDQESIDFLRHHAQVTLAEEPEEAAFVILGCGSDSADVLQRLSRGTRSEPETSATAIVALTNGGEPLDYVAMGPGIENAVVLSLSSASRSLIDAAQLLNADFPLGIELILCIGETLVGLPRTTRLALCRTPS